MNYEKILRIRKCRKSGPYQLEFSIYIKQVFDRVHFFKTKKHLQNLIIQILNFRIGINDFIKSV